MARLGAVRTRIVRRVVVSLLASVVTAVLIGVAGAPVYVFPRLDAPTDSAAVVVLGPPMVQRLIVAEDLVTEGKASRIFVSVPTNWSEGNTPRLHAMCLGQTQFDVTCFTPTPFTTEGEAIAVQGFLAQNDWNSMIAVTSLPHVSRARYLFGRCEGDARIEFVSDHRQLDLGDWIYEYAYQTAAFVKAFFRQGC